MSVTCGLIVVFALGGSSGATTATKHTISPIVEIVLGSILLLLASSSSADATSATTRRASVNTKRRPRRRHRRRCGYFSGGRPARPSSSAPSSSAYPGSAPHRHGSALPTPRLDLGRRVRCARLECHHAAPVGGPDRCLCLRASRRVIEVRLDRRRRAPVELLRSCSHAVLGGAGKQPSHLRGRGLLGVDRGHVGGERKRSRVRLASKKYVPSSPDNASRVAPQIPRSCQLTAAVNTEVAYRTALHDVD